MIFLQKSSLYLILNFLDLFNLFHARGSLMFSSGVEIKHWRGIS